MKERCLRAMEYHEKGLNCGQSVLLAFADITGFSEEQSMALASGFGGGLRCGGVCGVVNAAAVVLGMVYPATLENGAAGKKGSSELTKEYAGDFLRELGVTQHCRVLVVSGVELLCEMLEELA